MTTREAPWRWPAAALLTVLVIAASGALSAGPWPPWTKTGHEPEAVFPDVTVNAAWLSDHLGDRGVVILDARSRSSFLAGHIPTAVSVSSRALPSDETAAHAFADLGLTGRERIVCYGDASYSPDAGRLFWLLELAGATRVSLLEGGVFGWTSSGNAVVQDELPRAPAEWSGVPVPGRLATREDVSRSYGEADIEIIDTRSRAEWEGPASAPAARRWNWFGTRGRPERVERVGHIPHSLPFDFHTFLRPDGGFTTPEESRAMFAELGPRPMSPVDLSDEFIVHDGGSTGEGALGYFLLRRAGIETVRYYAGGWEEWRADATLPVVRILRARELMERLAESGGRFRADTAPPGFALFDVRHEGDYERGHIPGAVSLTSRYFLDSLDVFVDRHWPGLDRRAAPIVVYCYGPDCIRSRHCSTWAARKGFLNVERFYGGVEEWREEGGRLVGGE